ncbi:NUDIX domain-containing protein [Streptomyces sp. NPDC052042]|uniref:NUDIX domain-containing protein n=1 Tax=Streptomyces sp. NPDC052042 TaxID=3365683 RepID=UPI0037D34964
MLNELEPTPAAVPAGREIVAVVLTWRGRVGLFKRSGAVGHDAGKWHCISGYVDTEIGPYRQAIQEIWEETGLRCAEMDTFEAGPTLHLPDGRDGLPWSVHTFHANTTRRRIQLNWEHVAHRWVRPCDVPRFSGQVSWLREVLGAFE